MDSGLTRRQILQAGAAAGAVALSSDPLVQLAQAAKSKPLGKLTDIEHVIILIQENRSFDHYFGTYSGVEGYGSPAAQAVYEQAGYPVAGYEGKLLPFHLNPGMMAQCMPDITHSWVPQHKAWNNGAMDEFVRTHIEYDGLGAGSATMGYYEKSDLDFYYTLAENFTICDHYFCSTIGPTYPNRLYSMTGTLDPEGKGGGPLVETTFIPVGGESPKFHWPTMVEALQSAGITWKVYSGREFGFEDNVLGFFENVVNNPTLNSLAFEQEWPNDFRKDILHDELPQVSWIDTSLVETEHPGNSSAKIGERVVQEVLKNLLRRRKVWQKTALFITWDENGGFFDHVAPPTAPPGTPGEYLTVPDINNNYGGITGPVGLGFRVPMLVVSPFTRGGLVCPDVFDHTSTLRFLETRFGVEVPNLSEWRRETCGDLTSAFNFAAPPNPKKPNLPTVTLSSEEESCTSPAPVPVPPNSHPVQEPGTRGRPSGIV